MNLLNHWKLEELRIAIIRDLVDFIPADYYSSAPDNDSMLLAEMDWELYKLIGADKKKAPVKYSPRHIEDCKHDEDSGDCQHSTQAQNQPS